MVTASGRPCGKLKRTGRTDIDRKVKPAAWVWLSIAIAMSVFISPGVHIWIGRADGVLPYLSDYVNRAVLLGILLGVPQLRQAYRTPSAVQQSRDLVLWISRAGALSFFMVVVERFDHGLIEVPLTREFPNLVFFSYPRYGSDALRHFDLTIGLLLVALSEELLWRRTLMEMLLKVGWPKLAVIALSSVTFGCLHWPGGVGQIAYAALLGLFLAIFYAHYRSLWLVVTIHYLIDLEVFGYFNAP